ncbi:MAG: hypothetical protein A2X94_09025 [Bdellovibrionales bacterium GWB1_55_8]|nr:MAG: hypothetical protein A2X94_09025 [Bdellovibrionales bacterium GWB1_55_8]
MKAVPILLTLVFACSISSAVASDVLGGPTPVPTPECSLKFEKIGSKEIKVGSFATYFVRLENTSACYFDDLKIVDQLPDRAKFDFAYPEAKVEEGAGPDFGGEVKWKHIDLEPYETLYFEIRVHVVGPPDRKLINKACLFKDGEKLECDSVRTKVVEGEAE